MDKKTIGIQIKRLRLQQRKTQQEIADQTQLSKSLISRIENGGIIPTLASLMKIATALNSKISVLVGEEDDFLFVHDSVKEIEDNLVKTNKGYSIFPFAAHKTSKKFQPLLYVVKKEELEKHFTAHKGEEFYYVLKGEFKLRIGTEILYVKEGEGVYFDSSVEHETIPISDEVVILDILTE